jgi:Protein of unknown function (DUF2634).
MTLFPSIQPQIVSSGKTSELYREVKWDYVNNTPVFEHGAPVIVSGRDAVATWAWKALNTPRFIHKIYTWSFGSEIESLIGQHFSDELKKSEAARYIKECLLVNPYIKSVSNISAKFLDSSFSISCAINTIYGEVSLNV